MIIRFLRPTLVGLSAGLAVWSFLVTHNFMEFAAMFALALLSLIASLIAHHEIEAERRSMELQVLINKWIATKEAYDAVADRRDRGEFINLIPDGPVLVPRLSCVDPSRRTTVRTHDGYALKDVTL